MKVKITSDSTCDLSREIVEKYGIEIIPLYIVKDGSSFKDGIEISTADVFDHFAKTGNLCSTAAVNVSDYTEVFGRLLQEYDAIVHFTISSDMSACCQNALLAAEAFDGRVFVVDSRNLSTGIGQLAIEAAAMAAVGRDAADIKAEVERLKEKLDVSFVLDTLTYLYKGGRCSAVAALGANLLSLKPCIEVKSGKMGVGKKYRGNLEKCFLKYVEDKLSGADDVDYRRIFVTHSGVAYETVDHVKDAVRKYGKFEEVLETTAGCTISNHCGPNCLGILFFRK